MEGENCKTDSDSTGAQHSHNFQHRRLEPWSTHKIGAYDTLWSYEHWDCL